MAKSTEDIDKDLYGMAFDEFRLRLMGYRERWLKSVIARTQKDMDIDWELFDQMALRGVPVDHMTYIYHVSKEYLDGKVQEKYGMCLDDYVATARATMLAVIRNLQLTKNDTTMLKHLGEWYLEQKENSGNERLIKDLEIKVIYRDVNELDGIPEGAEIW
jgi:hypothetical protein